MWRIVLASKNAEINQVLFLLWRNLQFSGWISLNVNVPLPPQKKGGGVEEREKEIKEQKVGLRNTVFIIILQIKIYKLCLFQLALMMLCGG